MLHLPMKMIRKNELTKSNTNTADVTSAYRDDKQMQILSMLLLPMKMIENGSTANVTPAYEDDMKDANVILFILLIPLFISDIMKII